MQSTSVRIDNATHKELKRLAAECTPPSATRCPSPSAPIIESDSANGLDDVSAAQCQHLRAVSPNRIVATRGNVGRAVLAQLRETIAVILDLPDRRNPSR